MEISLDQLLASRDDRWHRQRELLKAYPELTLVCLTVVMPGKVKRNFHSLIVAQAAITALINTYGTDIKRLIARDQSTGYEAYAMCDLPIDEAKRLAVKIEDSHELGRLFDIDVISKDGSPVSRQALGLQARRCLLCEREARYCMRNHTHTQEQLQEEISKMVNDYVQRL